MTAIELGLFVGCLIGIAVVAAMQVEIEERQEESGSLAARLWKQADTHSRVLAKYQKTELEIKARLEEAERDRSRCRESLQIAVRLKLAAQASLEELAAGARVPKAALLSLMAACSLHQTATK